MSKDVSASVELEESKEECDRIGYCASLHVPTRGGSKGKTPELFERLDDKKNKDLRVLSDFISIFCQENHRTEVKEAFPIKNARLHLVLGNKKLVLCQNCRKLMNHSIAKLLLCPYDPKPMCKKCKTHCYAPGYREKIREVMRFSGLYLIKRGRLDLMIHYL